MKTLINNILMAYDDHGVGVPVIFLHAFPLNRHMWDGEVQALLEDQHYRLITLDWRGFGESEISSSPIKTVISTMVMLADDVAGLMDTLGIQKAVLCGLSMGGYAAFAFAQKYPERLLGLILADTRPEEDPPDIRNNRENMARLVENQGSDAIADLQIPRLLAQTTREQAPEVEIRVRQLIGRALPQGIAAAARGMAIRLDSSSFLSYITCPVLVLVGSEDAVTPPDVAQKYAARIPGAQFAVIPGAGHLSNLEQPRAFIQAIRQFLLPFVEKSGSLTHSY
jgi:pimeloyl-ACP methyl ester carboxylesterase